MSTDVQAPAPADSKAVEQPQDDRIFPNSEAGDVAANSSNNGENKPADFDQMRQISSDHDEGVEVVLDGATGKETTVAVAPTQDQNVFRAPHPVRPRAVRGGRPPHVHTSGSYGYGQYGYPPAPHHGEYHRGQPYPVPYAPSGSFDHQDGAAAAAYPGTAPTSHYSPHVQYPPQGARRPEELNVISPNHKGGHHHCDSSPDSAWVCQ